jgi:hypothetical protein
LSPVSPVFPFSGSGAIGAGGTMVLTCGSVWGLGALGNADEGALGSD